MSDETNEQVPKWLIFGADVAQTADGSLRNTSTAR